MNWRKRYPKPDPDALWCDDCLRWEIGDGRFPKVEPSRIAEFLARVLVVPLRRATGKLEELTEWLQIRKNMATGAFVVRTPITHLKDLEDVSPDEPAIVFGVRAETKAPELLGGLRVHIEMLGLGVLDEAATDMIGRTFFFSAPLLNETGPDVFDIQKPHEVKLVFRGRSLKAQAELQKLTGCKSS